MRKKGKGKLQKKKSKTSLGKPGKVDRPGSRNRESVGGSGGNPRIEGKSGKEKARWSYQREEGIRVSINCKI